MKIPAIILSLLSTLVFQTFAANNPAPYCLAMGSIAETRATEDLKIDIEKLTPHPRLLLKQGEEDNIKKAMTEYPALKNIHNRIMATALAVIKVQPVERLKVGKRLTVCTEATKRIFNLAYAYRMTGDIAMARRAEEEMIAICNFTDWNPSHFLDVAELVAGLAIGYDWLFDVLQPETKTIVRDAIIQKAFVPASNPSYSSQIYDRTTNWNSVCNSGLVLGALSIFEDAQTHAKTIIRNCVISNPKVLNEYGPDGGYPEGYAYWNYGTSFQVMLCDALETALGTDFGLHEYPGFLQSALFMRHMVAPSGQCFNFSDCSASASANMMLYWFADKLKDPSVIYLEKKYLDRTDVIYSEQRFLPCLMIFASRLNLNDNSYPRSNYWLNNGKTPVYTYRSGWDSPEDAFVGVKGGRASRSHAHMDAGSFVYEKDGVRWGIDLGNQNYESLESKGLDIWDYSQNGDRWNVFIYSNLNHNTLIFNDQLHNVFGEASIMETFDIDNKKGAKIDMRLPINNGKLVIFCGRSIYLDENNDLHVDDEINPYVENLKVQWVMMTHAIPTVSGNIIYLEQGGKTKIMTIPEGAIPYAEPYKPLNSWDMELSVPTYRVGYKMTIKETRNLITYSVTIKDKNSSGIDEMIEAGADMKDSEEYFNLQGIKIAKPEKGVVIRRHNGKTEKIIIK